LNNKQAAEKKNRHVTKRVGHPELWREEEGHSLMQIVNNGEGRCGTTSPSVLGEEKASNSS
jgi:secreted trypsin-like serine protease